jgi:hypothetical protein
MALALASRAEAYDLAVIRLGLEDERDLEGERDLDRPEDPLKPDADLRAPRKYVQEVEGSK